MLPNIKDESQQTEEERKVAAHVRNKVQEIRASANRIAHEGIWMTNIAYTKGYSGVTFNTNTRSFQPVNRVSPFIRKDKVYMNKILPTLQNRLAKLCKSPPKFDVRPETSNIEDKEAARLALQILTSQWEKLNADEKRIPLYMWLQQCGHSYMKICWDPTKGNRIPEHLGGQGEYEGDLRLDVVSPFEIFPDPLANNFEDVLSSWVIQAKIRKIDYFRSQYPGRGEAVNEEDVWLLSAQYQNRINSMNTRGPTDSKGMSTKHCAIELIKYEARSKEYPNGRMIVTANGILLEDKELPCGEIPFAKFSDIVTGGSYYDESTVTHARPIQDQYNRTIQRRAEWTKKLLAGKYSAAKGSGLQQEAMNDGTEVLYYTPVPNAPNAGQPTAVQVPMIPQWAYTEEQALEKMFNDLTGVNDVSRGIMPSASIPAVGMQLLQESDDSRVGIITEQHERAWARVGSLILKYVEKYYSIPRKMKIAGKNLQYTVKEFTGKDIRGNTDVFVIRGSTLPGSKALRRQEILNAFSQGLLGDPADPKVREKVLNQLEFGDVAEIWRSQSLVDSQIARGIESLKAGIDVPVSEFDKNDKWIEKLNEVRIDEAFDNYSDDVKSLIMNQIEQRLNMIMQVSNIIPPKVSNLDVQQEMVKNQDEDLHPDTAGVMINQTLAAQEQQQQPPPPQGGQPQ